MKSSLPPSFPSFFVVFNLFFNSKKWTFLGNNVCHREIANYSKGWDLFRKSTLYRFLKLFLKIFLGKISWLSVIKSNPGTCLVVQWLRLCSNAGDVGSIPGQGAKIPHASWTKNQNINNIITDSIKTFKMVHIKKKKSYNFPGGSVVKDLLANAGDTNLIPDPGRSHMPRGS